MCRSLSLLVQDREFCVCHRILGYSMLWQLLHWKIISKETDIKQRIGQVIHLINVCIILCIWNTEDKWICPFLLRAKKNTQQNIWKLKLCENFFTDVSGSLKERTTWVRLNAFIPNKTENPHFSCKTFLLENCRHDRLPLKNTCNKILEGREQNR